MKKTIQIILALAIGLLIGSYSSALAENSDKVVAQFAKFRFIVDGEEKALEADPLVYQGTTYLPVRVIANMLGKDVVYKADSRTIELNTPKKAADINVSDFRNYPPDIIRGQIKAMKVMLETTTDQETIKKFEKGIAEREDYLRSISEPVTEEYISIKEQLEVTQRNIEFTQEFLQHFPDNEDAKKHLHELEAEKARLESQLQTAE